VVYHAPGAAEANWCWADSVTRSVHCGGSGGIARWHRDGVPTRPEPGEATRSARWGADECHGHVLDVVTVDGVNPNPRRRPRWRLTPASRDRLLAGRNPDRRYQRTTMITSAGERKPAKPDLDPDTRAEQTTHQPSLPVAMIRCANSASWANWLIPGRTG
jgi:hypothetical protein